MFTDPSKELLLLPGLQLRPGLGGGAAGQCLQVQHYVSGTAGTVTLCSFKAWACLVCKPRTHSRLGLSCLSSIGKAYCHRSLSVQKKMAGERNSVAKTALGPRSSSPEALLLQRLPGSLVLLEMRATLDSAFFLSSGYLSPLK